jgi:hypothetical protein
VDGPTLEECTQKAIQAGALKPQGLKESMAAGVLEYQGQSFADTALAQARLEAWVRACLEGRPFPK